MEKDLANKIGKASRSAREALGLTQAEAAELLSLSTEFYARIERGQTLPSVPTLAKMARDLHVSADVLLGSVERSRPGSRTTAEGDPPELRRLIRRLRNAPERAVRVLNLLAVELARR